MCSTVSGAATSSAGCLDKFGVAGMVFYWGALALFVKYAAFAARGLTTSGGHPVSGAAGHRLDAEGTGQIISCIATPVIRLEAGGGFFSSVMESLVGVFESGSSYFANTVSFVRLAAYAMSHAALLVAAFMIADGRTDIFPSAEIF